ncbi:MAG TPA: GNAT family N-acetyltransferase [Mesotoga infera]|uniref:GNAT family N-acetyltransferase n=1 Tax=Mesotoga infera TaxID=1236046 RepID=A0A7C1H3J3_9BACT|nr:GNAT family N-acetyltransferase [Mesotoga infera]
MQSKIEEPKSEETALLHNVEPEKLQGIETIAEELGQNLMSLSVTELYTKGIVYVDNPEEPNIYVIWNCCDSILVGGRIEDNLLIPLRDLFSKTLMTLARGFGIPHLNFYSAPVMYERLGNILIGLGSRQVRRSLFQMRSSKDMKSGNCNNDNAPRRITRELLEMELTNTKALEGWIYSFWKDEESFLRNSGGYAVVRKGTILSWCIGVYRSADRIEVGLETVEESRNQGFGMAVSRACINEFLSNGLTVDWHCDSANSPSLSIARKLGFKEILEYSIYQIDT